MHVIYCVFLQLYLETFDGFSADSDEVMDRLPDGFTDESVDA